MTNRFASKQEDGTIVYDLTNELRSQINGNKFDKLVLAVTGAYKEDANDSFEQSAYENISAVELFRDIVTYLEAFEHFEVL